MLNTIQNKTRQLLHYMRGRRICFDLSPYRPVLRKINSLEPILTELPERELHHQAQSMVQDAELGQSLHAMLPKVFALGREISKRSLDLRHYDEQIFAGIALHQGSMVEMQTGEGKTLAVVLPAILNALTRQGVHIVTFNDYLARRDATWMGPIYQAFGLSVGYIQEGMSSEDRHQAYACDITYGTAREIGFDYLRDNLGRNIGGGTQQRHHVVFVDEADSILIDEARIPLVIAGSVPSETMNLYDAAEITRTLKRDVDFEIDDNYRNIFLTDDGITTMKSITLLAKRLPVPSGSLKTKTSRSVNYSGNTLISSNSTAKSSSNVATHCSKNKKRPTSSKNKYLNVTKNSSPPSPKTSSTRASVTSHSITSIAPGPITSPKSNTFVPSSTCAASTVAIR